MSSTKHIKKYQFDGKEFICDGGSELASENLTERSLYVTGKEPQKKALLYYLINLVTVKSILEVVCSAVKA